MERDKELDLLTKASRITENYTAVVNLVRDYLQGTITANDAMVRIALTVVEGANKS